MSSDRFPSVEVHIALAPMVPMLNMLKCWILAMRMFGGRCADARIIGTVGGEDAESKLELCKQHLANMDIELRLADQGRFERHGWLANACSRLVYPFEADVVVLADADVVTAGPLDDVLLQVYNEPAIAGMIELVSPFVKNPTYYWQGLYRAIGMKWTGAPHEHTGWGCLVINPKQRYCPPYFNCGFVAGPRDMMRDIGKIAWSTIDDIYGYYPRSVFQHQLQIALCIEKLGLPVHTLPVRYNCPNALEIEQKYPWEMPLLRGIHLLRRRPTHKMTLFSSVDEIVKFINTKWETYTHTRAAEIFEAILPALCSS